MFARPLRPRTPASLLAAATLAIVALALVPAGAGAAASQLTRYPYLTDVVGEDATINWATDRSSTSGRVTYGALGSESCTAHTVNGSKTGITVAGQPQYQWKAQLTGLQADTRYCYRVYLGPVGSEIDLLGADPAPDFLTQPQPGTSTPFSFAVLGDWGSTTASGNPQQAAVIQELASSGSRFAMSSGDISYPGGTQTSYGDLTHTGNEVSNVFGPDFWAQAGASIPMFPVTGNHGFNATFLQNWPQTSAAQSSGGRFQMETHCCLNGTSSKSYPSAWYAFDVGTARFYVLEASWSDTNNGAADPYKNDFDYHWQPTSQEYRWLEHDLATHPAAVKFAFFHYPLYSANADEASDPYLQGTNSLEGLLARYGVDIAFNGHAHIYQRNRAAPPNGLISYVTGGGGAKVAPATKCKLVKNVVEYAIGWSFGLAKGSACGSATPPTSADQVYHYLLVSVDGQRVTVTPTNALGQSFDVQTYDFPNDPPVDDTTPPTAPDGLTATAISGNRVDLKWSPSTDNVGVTDYRVYRNGTSIATLSDESDTTYSDTTVSPGTSYSYTVTALDQAGNESAQSAAAPVTTPGSGPAAPTFVKDRTGSVASGGGFDVPISTTAGDTLVASVAISAGSTNSVTSISDSAGNTWTKGPVGFLSGSNTRVEIWYARAATAVNNVHVTLKSAAAAAADVAEFSGIASSGALDASGGQGNDLSGTATTPSIITTGSDIVVAAINYPRDTTATLNGSDFQPLKQFGVGTGVHGHAAYDIAPLPALYSASWSLGASSKSGAAIAGFKVGP